MSTDGLAGHRDAGTRIGVEPVEPEPPAVDALNQAVELGIAEGKTFAHLDFSEWQASQLVPGASIITCVPFVASDPSPAVQSFVSRANAMPGGELVTHAPLPTTTR